MSLRTKLLVVVVGLPGLILLLALFLFVRADRMPAESIDRLIHLASHGTPEAIGPGLLRLARTGQFEQIYVVLYPGSDPVKRPPQIWTVEAYYPTAHAPHVSEPPLGPPNVDDAELSNRLVGYLRRADGQSPPFIIRHAFVAVKTEEKSAGDDSSPVNKPGIVALLRSSASEAEVLRWVIVGGMGLLMLLSYWMISRLVIRPLAGLSNVADRIADGDYAVDMGNDESPDEVGRTVRALKRMSREIAEYQGQLEDRVLSALGRIKKAEQHLVIAQRLAATGKLASGLAHEINNPLGGMKNAVRALARGDLDAERTQLYLDLISDGLTRVEQTVKQFLTFTPRNIEPRPMDLAEVVEKSVALAMHRVQRKPIDVKTSLPEAGTAIVFGDPHELQQVALNLVLNAADAIEEGTDGRVEVRVAAQGGEVLLAVSDNGMGMSAEDQDRCFDIFFTTKEVGEGSGMGLAVVHNVVTNHGGRIELNSRLGEGTTFQVFLPAESASDDDATEPVGTASFGQ
jgi:signal transduction histidine kinase